MFIEYGPWILWEETNPKELIFQGALDIVASGKSLQHQVM